MEHNWNQLCILPLTVIMNIQSKTILWAIVSLLGDISGLFSDDGVVWYAFMSELFAKNKCYVLIDTVNSIWVSVVGWFIGITVNAAMN